MPGDGGSGEVGRDARLAAAQAYLTALWAWEDGTGDDRLADQLLTVVTIDPGPGAGDPASVRTTFHPADDPDPIAEAIVAADARSAAVYLGVGATDASGRAAVRTAAGGYRRPGAEHITALAGLWIDVDVAGAGHIDTRKVYPPDRSAARQVIESTGLAPSLVVETGGGLHAYWRFAEPWLLGTEAEREEAAALARDWVSTIRANAKRIGSWDIDPVGDLARIMRAPGSTNRKGAPAAVRVVSTDHTARHEPDDLRAVLADDEVLSALAVPKVGPAELDGVDLQAIWAMVNSAAYRASDYTPEWIEAGYLDHPGNPIELAWTGTHPSNDLSTIDASIVRTALDHGATLGQACELIMCHGLRVRSNLDKIDPTRRTSYLIMTVGKFAATSRAARAERAAREEEMARLAGHRAPDVAAAPVGPESPAPAPPAASEPARTPDDAVTAPLPAEPADEDEPEDEPLAPVDRAALDAVHAGLRDPDPVMPTPGRDAEPEDIADIVAEHTAATIEAPDPERAPVDDPGATRFYETTPGDPWGQPSEDEAEQMDALTRALLPRPFVDRDIKVWRIEYKDYGAEQKARLVLRLPRDFAWPTGERPGRYHPGQPFATEWRPRMLFDTYKGFHQAVKYDARLRPKPIAGDGAAPDAHQASKGEWAALIDGLVPYWRRDSTRTDMASAAWDWLLSYLLEHPPIVDVDEAAPNRRPIMSEPHGWDTSIIPTVVVSTRALLDYIAVQPGVGLAGRHAKGVLDYLSLESVRLRTHDMRGRWAVVRPEQFDLETWGEIVDSAANIHETRVENGWRRGLRPVGADERAGTTAAQRLRLASTASGEFAPEPEDTEP